MSQSTEAPDPAASTARPADFAALAGLSGRGYAVVETLPSLGKGRRLTGLFRTDAGHAEALRAHAGGGRRVAFEGTVHFRHHSVRATVTVEIARVDDGPGEVVAEFTAYDVPYSLG